MTPSPFSSVGTAPGVDGVHTSGGGPASVPASTGPPSRGPASVDIPASSSPASGSGPASGGARHCPNDEHVAPGPIIVAHSESPVQSAVQLPVAEQ